MNFILELDLLGHEPDKSRTLVFPLVSSDLLGCFGNYFILPPTFETMKVDTLLAAADIQHYIRYFIVSFGSSFWKTVLALDFFVAGFFFGESFVWVVVEILLTGLVVDFHLVFYLATSFWIHHFYDFVPDTSYLHDVSGLEILASLAASISHLRLRRWDSWVWRVGKRLVFSGNDDLVFFRTGLIFGNWVEELWGFIDFDVHACFGNWLDFDFLAVKVDEFTILNFFMA